MRWLTVAGTILIFNTWLLDHWYGSTKAPFLTGWLTYLDVTGYLIGLFLIILCFGMLIGKQIFYFTKLVKLRTKYNLQKLDKDFHLVWFNGKLILFDIKIKKYYHIRPWETAQDLLFIGYGEQVSMDFYPTIKFDTFRPTGASFDVENYKNGGIIDIRL